MASKKVGNAKQKVALVDDGAGAEAAVEQHRARAAALPAKDVRRLGGDPALARHNVGVALEALEPHDKALGALPAPFSRTALGALGGLAAAVVHATAQVDHAASGETKKKLARAAELRTRLLNGAVSLGDAGLVPAARVAKIKKGSGPRDVAQDCVDLAALYREHAAAIKGKTAIGKAEIDEAGAVGEALLSVLKPKAAKGKASAETRAAADLRDRLWTLLVGDYEAHARRAGMWLWVGDVDDHVPTLQARAGRRAKKPADAAPAPKAGG